MDDIDDIINIYLAGAIYVSGYIRFRRRSAEEDETDQKHRIVYVDFAIGVGIPADVRLLFDHLDSGKVRNTILRSNDNVCGTF